MYEDDDTRADEVPVDDVDDGVAGVPLPRRGARQGRIMRAHERLYGGAGASGDRDRVGWVDVGQRERSAALARAASSRGRGDDRRPSGPEHAPATGATVPDVPEPAAAEPAASGSEPAAAGSAVPEPREDGDQVPEEPPPPPSTAGAPRRRWPRVLVAATLVLLTFVAGTLVGLLAAPSDAAVGGVGGPDPLPSQPTLVGDVVRVQDGSSLTVLVGDRSVEVAILGLDAPRTSAPPDRQCGAEEATAFASRSLAGHRVTLVPDPAGPELDAAGRRWAYVVLETQQNYTDLALLEGIGRWDTSRALSYGQVFAREQATARTDGNGIWGAPCRARS